MVSTSYMGNLLQFWWGNNLNTPVSCFVVDQICQDTCFAFYKMCKIPAKNNVNLIDAGCGQMEGVVKILQREYAFLDILFCKIFRILCHSKYLKMVLCESE